MSLDIFQRDEEAQNAYVMNNSAPELPATFGETFSTALNESFLFSQSISRQNARRSAIGDHADRLIERSGGDPEIRAKAFAASTSGDVDGLNGILRDRPDIDLPPLTEEEIDRRGVGLSRQARADYQAMQAREKTTGGAVGSFLGSLAGGATDPVNIVTFPLAAPRALGIVGTALAWSGIAGGTQTAIQIIGNPYQEQVEPGYTASGEPLTNIAGAAVVGGVIGGGLKGLANAWTRAKYGRQPDVGAPTVADDVQPEAWPRSIRDAGNVVESEANIAETNPFGATIEGEAAHRAALSKAMDDLIEGRPVEVDEIVGAQRGEYPYPGREGETASWVIREKGTGNVIMETFDKAKVTALNTEKYEAVSIQQYLGELNAGLKQSRFEKEAAKAVPAAPEPKAQTEMPLAQPVSPIQRAISDEMTPNLTPQAMREARADPLTDDAVALDLDRLRANKDFTYPDSEAFDDAGRPMVVQKSVDQELAKIDERIAAAKEIEGCATLPAEAAE